MRKNEKCVTCEASDILLFECDECGALVCESCRTICVVCDSILCVDCALKNSEREFVCPDCKEGE